MSKVTFRVIARFDGTHVVEVWDGKEFIAGIYGGERSVRVISKHRMTETRDETAAPPVINIEIGR
jgi:Leu/Phe-tRNA-protein transferase